MFGFLFGRRKSLDELVEGVRRKTRSEAKAKFDGFQVGDRVRTTKEYPRWCGGKPLEGIVIGKKVLADQAELDRKHPALYASTNPDVVSVKTSNGRVKELNVIWLVRF